MVPCLHQRNTYLQWKIRVWGEQKCIALVSGETPPACAGRETTLSQRGLYWAENGNLCKLGWNYCLGTVFPQRQCLYQKEAACMETTEIYSTSRCRNPTYVCGLANYPVSWGRYRAENGNLCKFLWTYRNGTIVCTKAMSISKGRYGYGENRNVFY